MMMLTTMLGTLLTLTTVDDNALSNQLRYDNRGRPVIETRVNQQGPFYMVVDTAAQSTLISPRLAEKLELPAQASGMTVNGMTGNHAVDMYPIDHFSSAFFELNYVGLLALPNADSTPAAGIIGMDLWAAQKLVFHTQAGHLQVLPSATPVTGFTPIAGTTTGSTLLTVPISIDGKQMSALIDSGAAATIANAAVLKQLGWQSDDPRLIDDGTIKGATANEVAIKKAHVSLALGPITIEDFPIRFITEGAADAAQITLGVDLLNHLPGYSVDFAASEFAIQMPSASSDSE